MSQSTCAKAITSINDLLIQANANRLNITTTVASCPDICSLAWGSGNPDLSGIGANISYIFQGILTILCGPVLCLIYELRHRWELSESTQKHLSTLHDTFLDISAQFSIPVAIAAVIRFRQQAPFYELSFLRSLTTMQFLSLLSTAVTVGLFEGDYRRKAKRVTIIVIYGLLEFAFYMGLIQSLITSRSSWGTISELSEACNAYGQIFPWIKHIPPPAKVHLPHITVKQFFNPFSRQGWKFALIIIGFVMAGTLALTLSAFIVYYTVYSLRKILLGREEWRRLVIPMSLAFAVATLVEVVEMERTRNVMKSISGADFQDNQWGFGQVIALFLWVPLCSQFAYYVMRFDYHCMRRNKPASHVKTGGNADKKDVRVGDVEVGSTKAKEFGAGNLEAGKVWVENVEDDVQTKDVGAGDVDSEAGNFRTGSLGAGDIEAGHVDLKI